MSKNDILEWFAANNEALSTGTILLTLAVGFVIGLIIFITYRISFRGVSYSAKFNVGNVVLVLVAAVIMLMISSNIAISLGMVGALSIVRYRTAVKDPHDTVYIFWSIVEGLCVGAQLTKLAVVSTIFIALVLLMGSFYYAIRHKYLIIVHGDGSLGQEKLVEIIRKYYPKSLTKSVNTTAGHSEMIFEINSQSDPDAAMIEELKKTDGVTGTNWLLEMGEHVG